MRTQGGFMTGHAIRRAIAVLAVVCIGGGWLAACGDDDDTSSDNTEDTSGSDSTDQVSADPLRFCFQGSKDVALVNLLEALDQMTDMGYEIEQPFVAETE